MKVLLCMVLLAAGTNATLLQLLGGNGGLGGGNSGGGGGNGHGRGGYGRGGYGGGPGGAGIRGGGNNEIRHVRILTPIPIVNVGQGGGYGGGGGGIGHGRNIHGHGGNEVIIVKLIHENAGPGPAGHLLSGSGSGVLNHGANAGGAISGFSSASLSHSQEERIVRVIHENAPGPSQEYIPPNHSHGSIASSNGLHQHLHHGAPQEERVIRIIHEHEPASAPHHFATASSGGIHSNAGGQEEVVRIIHEDADSSSGHLSSSSSSDLLPSLSSGPIAQSHQQYLPPHQQYLPPHSHNHGHHY